MKSKLAYTGLIVAALLAPALGHAAGDQDVDRGNPKAFVKDSAITTKVKAKLAAEKLSSLATIHVDTDANGIVAERHRRKSGSDRQGHLDRARHRRRAWREEQPEGQGRQLSPRARRRAGSAAPRVAGDLTFQAACVRERCVAADALLAGINEGFLQFGGVACCVAYSCWRVPAALRVRCSHSRARAPSARAFAACR
jgi:hyperosmotically inducible protein